MSENDEKDTERGETAMTDRFTERLSEYLDGELSTDDMGRVEMHLGQCERCAHTLEELRQVVERANRLSDRTPPDDLWPGIAARIRTGDGKKTPDSSATVEGSTVIPWRRRRIAISIPQLAAAAVLLMAFAGGMTWWMGSGSANGSTLAGGPGVGDASALSTASLATAPAAERYATAIEDLERALFDPDGTLPPATAAKIRSSLRTIDRAIEDARRALKDAPADGYLRQHLTATMRRKIEYLRQTARLVSQS